MGKKSGLNGGFVLTEGDPSRHQRNYGKSRIVQRKDGLLVELRPGFRPRVLSKAEVEALKKVGGNE